MQPTQYIALIGDLVASRRLPASRRRQLQRRLADYLDAFESSGTKGIAAQPLITLGDEFQALFQTNPRGVRSVLQLIKSVLDLARPTAVRFGLGIGSLSTARQKQALGMDGPCYHRARSALERARVSDLPCQLESGDPSRDRLWSTLGSYALRQRFNWTNAQREAIEYYEKLGAWNRVAETLKISGGAVSQRQRAAGYSLFCAGWDTIEQYLGQLVPSGAPRSDVEV